MADKKSWSEMTKGEQKQYFASLRGLYGQEPIADMPKILNMKPKVKRKVEPLEWRGQAALVNWARKKGLPLISIPNSGKRSYWQGQKERAMGLTAGVSDLFLAMPNHKYFGFWIEMKAKGKKPTESQNDWLKKMIGYGYAAAWFDDWEKARDAIDFYIAGIDNVS